MGRLLPLPTSCLRSADMRLSVYEAVHRGRSWPWLLGVEEQLGVSNSFASVVCTGFHGAAAMPIRFLLEEDHAFSPDDVKILVDAFEGTLRALGLADPEDPSSIKVAKIIVGLAKDGERDPARLRELALKFVRPS